LKIGGCFSWREPARAIRQDSLPTAFRFYGCAAGAVRRCVHTFGFSVQIDGVARRRPGRTWRNHD
ncbi:hypothetical protein SB778_37240, partial [Paraburkholderia sp. SIMBA_050]